METISEKYKRVRGQIKDGDFILFSGTGVVASVIREADSDSFASHIGRVVKLKNRFLIVDSNARGNKPEWLSTRIESYYKNSDFIVIRSSVDEDIIQSNVVDFINESDEARTKYDFRNGIKELLNRAFGFKLKIKLRGKYNICSQSVRKSFEALNMGTLQFTLLSIAFPQDYIRFRNEFTTELLFEGKY
jgi:adenine-specific DNA methylase